MSASKRCRAFACLALALLAGSTATMAAAQEWQAALRAADYDRAQTALESALAERPDDTALRYELARVLVLRGSHEAALAELDALLARHPNDADYLLGRAQTLARLGQDAAAAETADRALRIAPEYEDVWELRLRLAERGSDDARTSALRNEIAARFPDATWWRRRPAPPEYTRWLSADFGGDRLSSGAPDWSRRSVRIDWRTPTDAAFYGAVADSERFNRSDTSLALGGNWQALPQWRLGAGVALASDAEFEADRELSLEAQRPWANGWGTELGYRRREYSSTAVTSYSVTGDKYLADFRIAYKLDYSRLAGGGASAGHSVTFGWFPTEQRTLGVTLGAGEEIETIELDRLLRTRVSSVTLTGRETLSERFALSWWLGTHRQGEFYRRRYAGLALRVGI